MKIMKPFILIFLSFIIYGCGKDIPVIKDISKTNYKLIDQDSTEFNFPKDLKGKTAVVSYIYTYCPDICPLITHNVISIKELIDKEEIKNVEYVEISFDPDRDTPGVLKNYAAVRGIKSADWHLLTGDKKTIYKLLDDLKVRAMPGDTTMAPNGDTLYYYIHTDRISLIDKYGKLRANFKGSTVNKEKIINTIKEIN